MILDNYDDFNFMVILLFLYFILIGFIIIIIINIKNRVRTTHITVDRGGSKGT